MVLCVLSFPVGQADCFCLCIKNKNVWISHDILWNWFPSLFFFKKGQVQMKFKLFRLRLLNNFLLILFRFIVLRLLVLQVIFWSFLRILVTFWWLLLTSSRILILVIFFKESMANLLANHLILILKFRFFSWRQKFYFMPQSILPLLHATLV